MLSAPLAALLAGCAVALAMPPGRSAAWRRLLTVTVAPAERSAPTQSQAPPQGQGQPATRSRGGSALVPAARGSPRVGRLGAACLLGLAASAAVTGPPGVVTGVVVAVVAHVWLGRLEPRGHRRRRERLAADLPGALDLFAACLSAGGGVVDAAEAVGRAVGGPLEEELRAVTAVLRLGADPVAAWGGLAVQAELAPLARALARASEGGAPVAWTTAALADDARARRRAAGEIAARRVGVRAVAPLAVCFLPAFLVLGVVPVIVGITGELLSSLS